MARQPAASTHRQQPRHSAADGCTSHDVLLRQPRMRGPSRVRIRTPRSDQNTQKRADSIRALSRLLIYLSSASATVWSARPRPASGPAGSRRWRRRSTARRRPRPSWRGSRPAPTPPLAHVRRRRRSAAPYQRGRAAASRNIPIVVAASARTRDVAVARAAAPPRCRPGTLRSLQAPAAPPPAPRASVAGQRRGQRRDHRRAARSGPAPAPWRPAPRSRRSGSTAPPPSAGIDDGLCELTQHVRRVARRRPNPAAPAGSAWSTLHLAARPRAAPATRPPPGGSARFVVVDQRRHQVDAGRADQVLGALQLGLDGVDRARGDGMLDRCWARPPAGDRGPAAASEMPRNVTDCELHCLVRVHVVFSVTGSPSQRCSGSPGRRTARPCRCSGSSR